VTLEDWEVKLTPDLRRSVGNAGEVRLRVVIESTAGQLEQVKLLITNNHGNVGKEMKDLSMLAAEVPTSLLRLLAKMDQVKMICPDRRTKIV